jgi:hypothetical protein
MPAPPARVFAVAFSLFFAALGPPAVAAPGGDGAYPSQREQQHVGARCTPDDTQVAGGTIIGLGGQVVAGGGGTGAGCDTFYAYEVRTGEPKTATPWAEPAIYLNPGGAVSR